MASKFFSNAILTGSIDSYCLACNSYLKSEEDGNMHVEKPIHKKNLDAILFVEKYPNEHIRKVKKGYYCEFCNLLFPTAAKVNLHINEHSHSNNKGTNLLKRVGNSVIAFKNVSINEKAWNGFIDDTCVICNFEFDNEDIHKTDQMHLLSLVQSKLEFGVNNSIYRKIDDSSYQCLTCNTVHSIVTMSTHFDNAQHKELYEKCRDNAQNVAPALEPEKVPVESQDRNIVQKEAIPLPDVKEPTTQKIAKPVEKTTKPDNVDPDARYCDLLDAKDYIMNNEGKLWCILCEWTIDNVSAANHLTSQHHITLLKLHKARLEKQQASSNEETIQPERTDEEEVSSVKAVDEDRDNLLDSISKYQSNDINIDFFSNTAYCKKCSKDIEFVSDAIDSHIEQHQKSKNVLVEVPFSSGVESTENKTDKHILFTKPVFIKKDKKAAGSRSNSVTSLINEELEKFAQQNNMSVRRNDNKVNCDLCGTQVPISLKSMKEHINGGAHKVNLAKHSEVATEKKQNKQVELTKRPTSEFILHVATVHNTNVKDIVINDKYVLSLNSFFLLTKQSFGYKCESCNITIAEGQIVGHRDEKKHDHYMQTVPVITDVDSEFVREVRIGVYHCGYCNTVECNWSDMLAHFKTTGHRESKVAAEWRLKEYDPIMKRDTRRKNTHAYIMNLMLHRNMF